MKRLFPILTAVALAAGAHGSLFGHILSLSTGSLFRGAGGHSSAQSDQTFVPSRVALLDSGSGSTVNVSIYTQGMIIVPFTDKAAPPNTYSSVQVTLTASASTGLGYLLSTTKPDATDNLNVPGIYGGQTVILTIATGTVYFNTAGTPDGTVGAGSGIAAGYTAPLSTDLKMVAGDTWMIATNGRAIRLSGSSSTPANGPNTNLPSGATQENSNDQGTPITTATTVQVFAAASGKKHYVTDFSISNSSSTASVVQVLDGSTIIWSGEIGATGGGFSKLFIIPKVGSTNTSLSIKVLTASASITWDFDGYTL